ncbi:MAG: hypothetical protein L0Y58_07175, partial [Verrucomicrobia subdivision 3 bacterium]|nr:hypothetical protein [Limisphaerales bacterium]
LAIYAPVGRADERLQQREAWREIFGAMLPAANETGVKGFTHRFVSRRSDRLVFSLARYSKSAWFAAIKLLI